MQALRARPTIALAGRRARRAGLAALCVSAVLLGHGALWSIVSAGSARLATPAAVVQVRRVNLPAAPAREPEPRDLPREVRAPVAPLAVTAHTPNPAVPARDPPSAAAATREAAQRSSGSDMTAAASSPSPTPIYPTRVPPSVQLHFTLQSGDALGEASLHWRVDEGGYVLELQASTPQGRAVEQRSEGGFDEAGLAPLRLADRRRGRDVRAANFQREHGKISFSGPRVEWPLFSGAQDRLSWLVQLVAIAAAAPEAMREGAEVSMWVAGARGAFGIWRFEVRGREPLAAPGGDTLAWCLVREPAHPYDVRIEVWLDPARGHWPVRLRQTQVHGGEPLQWTLRDEPRREPRS